MREIKFRAWDENPQGDEHQMLFFDLGDDGYNLPWIYKNCIVMQYTGLKDKNGKEIYEGDIVGLRFHEAPDGESFEVGLIEWHKPSAAFKWVSDDPADGNNYWLSEADDEYREINGNIYENPELLK